MDYSVLADIGIAAAIAIAAKRELGAFRGVMEQAIKALTENIQELTRVENVQDEAITRLFKRVNDLEDMVIEICDTTKAIATMLEDREESIEELLDDEKFKPAKNN